MIMFLDAVRGILPRKQVPAVHDFVDATNPLSGVLVPIHSVSNGGLSERTPAGSWTPRLRTDLLEVSRRMWR